MIGREEMGCRIYISGNSKRLVRAGDGVEVARSQMLNGADGADGDDDDDDDDDE
jgi:hypothetical protein